MIVARDPYPAIWQTAAPVHTAVPASLACVQFCYVSKAVRGRDIVTDLMHESATLLNMMPVRITHNPVLKAIMDARPKWKQQPIVWANGKPYCILVLEDGVTHSVLIQMSLRIVSRGKFNVLEPVNKRSIVIMY